MAQFPGDAVPDSEGFQRPFMKSDLYKSFAVPIFIFIFGVVISCFWKYSRNKGNILNEIDKRLLYTAQSIKLVLSEDFHDRANTEKGISKAEFRDNAKQLNKFAELCGVDVFFTAVNRQERMFLTAINLSDKELAEEEIYDYWHPLDQTIDKHVTAHAQPGVPISFMYSERGNEYRGALLVETSSAGNRYIAVASIRINHINQVLFREILFSVFDGVMYFLISFPLVLAVVKFNTKQMNQLEKARIDSEKLQLQMLRYQLNPHFLFNTLNSINSLIPDDPASAGKMILLLSEFCRGSLSHREAEFISLRTELEVAQSYLEIARLRWGDRLKFNIDCEPNLLERCIPGFLFQPLIENAIKYGQLSDADPLIINIAVKTIDDKLLLEVANTGRWFPPDSTRKSVSTRVGLENLQKRLYQYFGEGRHFESTEDNGWVFARIFLPQQTPEVPLT